MSIWEWIRLIAGGALLLGGVIVFLIEVYGVYRMKYVLNRMHAAALGDTLGIGCSMAGLVLLSGFRFATLKMILIVVFLWITSPVSSHLLARLEAVTNEKLGENGKVYEELETLEAQLQEERLSEAEIRAQEEEI